MFLNDTNGTDFSNYTDVANTTEPIYYYYGEPSFYEIFPFSTYIALVLIGIYFGAMIILKMVANNEE